jgi:cell wall-associated NlpC family hydrolase
MALDPSIALGVKPIELQNPLAQYAQVAQIQGAQNQNALAQYQLSAAQRADAQANVMNELYAKHFNPATGALNQAGLNADLIARNQAGQIPAIQTKLAEAESKTAGAAKAKADAAKAQTELIDRAKREISARPSDANIT